LPDKLARRGVCSLTPSEALERFAGRVFHLPLPIFPTTWAGSGGIEFFLGNAAQQAIFQLMAHTYGVARLSENPALLDLALWLAQSDNLHLIQWFGRSGPEAEVSAYFTPRVVELALTAFSSNSASRNRLRAMEYHLPKWGRPANGRLPRHTRSGAPAARCRITLLKLSQPWLNQLLIVTLAPFMCTFASISRPGTLHPDTNHKHFPLVL
jgi:hypothetical protein